jgi:DNA-directed RNA polymerase specialized sigma24 family protein
MNKRVWTAPEERMGIAALAIGDALKHWDSTIGTDFALVVHYYTMKHADEHRKRFSQCLRLPMHYKVETHGEFSTINPDGFRRDTGEDAGVDYWDNLLQCTQDAESVSEELKTVLARMPEKYKKVYHLFYECDLRHVDICELTGVSNTGINERLKAMRSWVKKELKKDEMGRKLGTNGKKSDP